MELKQFIKTALTEIVEAVDEVSSTASRNMYLSGNQAQRSIEFDIAVTVESTSSQSGQAGIKVWELLEAGGDLSREKKNAEVSRICFGVQVQPSTKSDQARASAIMRDYANGNQIPDQF